MLLPWTIYFSFLGAALLALAPRLSLRSVHLIALTTSIASAAVAVLGTGGIAGRGLVTLVNVPWIASLGIRYHLAADGISAVMVLLTAVASIAGVLFSWNITLRAREYFAFYLALIGGVYGVFLSFDVFLLFVFYELAIIPKYFLIAIWGSTRREYAAMKLVLYSFAGSAMVLAGLIAAYALSPARSTDLLALAAAPAPASAQLWLFPLVFVGFAILAGLWPFHTWAPTGHVAAPTAASMLLAGVVMKLGAYGALRVAIPLFPAGLAEWPGLVLGFHSWREVFAVLAVAGIVLAAMIALTQKDLKFVIGYSSVSHMGFVLLGLMTVNAVGYYGAVYQMFSHGVIAGLLFAAVGRMVYDRTHTRQLAELEKIPLRTLMPFAGGTFLLAAVAGMGMPGFSGFIAELQVLVGAWRVYPTLAVVAGAGIVMAVAYSLRALERTFHSDAVLPVSDRNALAYEPISVPERIGAVLLLGSTLVAGLYPRLLLDLIASGFETPLFDALRRGGAW